MACSASGSDTARRGDIIAAKRSSFSSGAIHLDDTRACFVYALVFAFVCVCVCVFVSVCAPLRMPVCVRLSVCARALACNRRAYACA